MLKKCPECDLPVSDKALTCPHCGYPLVKSPKPSRQPHHMRLPNGFGQISQIKNKPLRKPWRVMVTVGKTDTGRPICKLLKPQAYFKTYNEAYEALVEYNRNPYDLDDCITMSQLYERWSEEYFKTLKSESSQRTVRSAWAYCSSVYNLGVKEIKAKHIKYCMENCTSPNISMRIKSIMNLMLDYALEHELVEKNVARTFNLPKDIVDKAHANRKDHESFTDDELKLLWENITVPYVDMIVIQCYMGWRPQELCNIRVENVDLERKNIVGGMKTEAGTNRVVPIHNRIRPLIEARMKLAKFQNSEMLFTAEGLPMTYDKYNKRFISVCKALGMSHRAHDPRKTFVTRAKKYNMDEYAIKRIVGHAIDDITEKLYTQRGIDWLCEEMQKIVE